MRALEIIFLVFLPGLLHRHMVYSFDPPPTPVIRIMPLGDLTVGNNKNTSGYRRALYYKLLKNKYNFDFIGTVKDDVTKGLGDRDYEGRDSWTIEKVHDSIQDILEDVKVDVDVILLLIGGYDTNKDVTEATARDAIKRWDDLILRIASLQPFAHILASNLTPQESGYADKLFNPFVEDMVDAHIAAGRRVTFVDMNSAFSEDELVNSMHPGRLGYQSMANTWMEKISQVIGPYGDNLPVGITRVESSLDRRGVTLTFSKPLINTSSNIENFVIDHELQVLSSTFDSEKRKIILRTSLQIPGTKYEISFPSPHNIIGLTGSQRSLKTESISFTVGWRFINLSDWHSAEKYIFADGESAVREKENDRKNFSFLKKNYGGDFLMIPGDTNAGFWDKGGFRKRMEQKLGSNISQREAVFWGGNFCYGGMFSSVRAGGYSKILIVFGDHEAGDNPWSEGSAKSKLQSEFRKTFTNNFNLSYDGSHRFNSSIGEVPSRPINTIYSGTSHAYIHKNALIVTVDVLYQKNPYAVIGKKGTVDGQVTGPHLDWLDNVLKAGRNLPQVKHIFVQGHFPVLHPVRRNKSSGQLMTNNEASEFWQMLKKHRVDIYFCGEVHLNTVTKDDTSNLIQIASRGNQFNNFLTVDVSDDTIDISLFNEIGEKPVMYNYDYEKNGRLIIMKNTSNSEIIGNGELALLDRNEPMIHFNFEEIVSLRSRPVIGLGYLPSVKKNTPKISEVLVQGIECAFSLPNIGQFGQNYDAQVGNMNLVQDHYRTWGDFTEKTRAAVLGMGPHSEGRVVSYALWFKSSSSNTQILISYEGWWFDINVMNLRLVSGTPELVISKSQKLVGLSSKLLNDDNWRHIAVTLPFKDCKLSEVQMFVDGQQISTSVIGNDETINFPNGGLLAIGGFGHGRTKANNDIRDGYTNGSRFIGGMDEIFVFSKSLTVMDVKSIMYGNNSHPSSSPSVSPSPSESPSKSPSVSPSMLPSVSPSMSPSMLPTESPSEAPSEAPSESPSVSPSVSPSMSPLMSPSVSSSSSESPSESPSVSPSMSPSPSISPSISPSRRVPSKIPSTYPPISPPVTPSLRSSKPSYASSEALSNGNS